MPPALRCIPGPSANRAKSLLTSDIPGVQDTTVSSPEGSLHSFCTCTEVRSSGKSIHGPVSRHLESRDLKSVKGFLVEAVLSCSPGPYTEFCVQQQAVAAAVVLCGEYLTLGSSLQHHEAFSDWPASVVSLFSPGGSWGGKAVLGKSCHMLAVGSRPAAFWLSSVTVRAHYRHSPTGGNPVSHRVNVHHFLESLC